MGKSLKSNLSTRTDHEENNFSNELRLCVTTGQAFVKHRFVSPWRSKITRLVQRIRLRRHDELFYRHRWIALDNWFFSDPDRIFWPDLVVRWICHTFMEHRYIDRDDRDYFYFVS